MLTKQTPIPFSVLDLSPVPQGAMCSTPHWIWRATPNNGVTIAIG